MHFSLVMNKVLAISKKENSYIIKIFTTLLDNMHGYALLYICYYTIKKLYIKYKKEYFGQKSFFYNGDDDQGKCVSDKCDNEC